MSITAGCLFSGMGGFASGLADAGFDIAWANDNDPAACKMFRHRFPDVDLVEKDIRELSVAGDGLASVDVLAGGFPCQSFSVAGGRRGFDDPRGQVFLEIPRLIEEFSSPPRLLILENVPYLLSGADGAWFHRIQKIIREAGYWFRKSSCWRVNVKDATRIPQDRERLFLVAASREHYSHNPFTTPSPPEAPQAIASIVDRRRKGDPDIYLPPDNKYCLMIEAAMATGESQKNLYQLRRSYVREIRDGLCQTLTANMGRGGHNVPFLKDRWGIRRLSLAEVAKLQGFDAARFPHMPERDILRLLGNAVCVELATLVGRQCAEILQSG